MQDTGISDQVREFLNDHISSVAQLEALLLLQTNSRQGWTSAEIARELRTEAPGTEKQLELLLAGKLLRREGETYFYSPASEQLHATVIALAQAYLVRRVTIISLIFAKPSDSLRAFSEAFRLRKEGAP